MEDGTIAYINKEEMNSIVHQLIYGTSIYPNLPLFLEHVIDRDTEVLKNIVPMMRSRVELGYNPTGIVEYVYDHKTQTNASRANFSKNEQQLQDYAVVDSYWKFYLEDSKIKTDSMANTPLQSDVPALLLAGSFDPVTPPEWSESMTQRFSTSYYFELPKAGHGVAPTPCGREIMNQFVEDP